tara:strand:+ start:286 stop:819 length:534 start_codon:yes stop_codon:yes gene_type:complete
MADDYAEPMEMVGEDPEEPQEEPPDDGGRDSDADEVPDDSNAPVPQWDNPMLLNDVTILTRDAATGFDPRTTDRYLTKYERARVLGIRAEQIALGSPLMVDRGDLTDPMEIAEKELRARKLPLLIHRKLTDQLAEEWDVNELLQREKLLINPLQTEVQTGALSAPRGVGAPAQATEA